MTHRRAIAIVGLAGRFPGAPSVEALWELVAAGKTAAREVPADRWPAPAEDVVSSSGGPDTARSRIACLLDGFELDLGDVAIPTRLEGRLSRLAQLTLQVGVDAVRGVKLDRARTKTIVANIALPTEGASKWSESLFLGALEKELKGTNASVAAEPMDAFPSALPVGLLAEVLGLGGGSFTLDAACASSLYALHLGCLELEAGRANAVLAGGVSLPQPLYTQIGFTQLQALSPSGICAPFGAHADGLVVGEGAGLVVLKRLDDAQRDGDRIWGVIRGVGISNDVGGSLLSPDSEGQLRAMKSAFAQAGWSPREVSVIECHGTGTPRGDAVELESLATMWAGTEQPAVIGSVKSNVGHLLTAAGMAGLTKVLLAISKGELPPSANVTQSTLAPSLKKKPFRVLERPESWARPANGGARRAAVSGFGFGGINAHLLVEEHVGQTERVEVVTAHEPVALVGLGVRAGSLKDLNAFRLSAVMGNAALTPRPANRWNGLDAASGESAEVLLGGWIDALEIPPGRFKIPPVELPMVLKQQLLMLQVAAAAVEDAGGLGAGPHLKTGTIVGLGLDLESTAFQLRWVLQKWAREHGLKLDDAKLARIRDSLAPPLNAQRTLGALGGIVASRLARELSLGGPSFGVQADEASGLRALEVATRLLQQVEVDRMVVGAVEVAGDLRRVVAADQLQRFSRKGAPLPFDPQSPGRVPGEGAAAVVLKRLSDAKRDGDRVYAVLRGIGSASGATRLPEAFTHAWAEVGSPGAQLVEAHAMGTPARDLEELEQTRAAFGDSATVSSIAGITGDLGAAAGLTSLVRAALALHHQVLPGATPRAWARNRIEGARRAGVTSLGTDGSAVHVVLEEVDTSDRTVASAIAGHRAAGFFRFRESTREKLKQFAQSHRSVETIDQLATQWHQSGFSGGDRAIAVSTREQLERELQNTSRRTSPLKGEVAFVFPGSGTHFDGMGRSLHLALPEVLARLDRDSSWLAKHLSPPEGNPLANIIVRHVTHGLAVAEGLKLLGVKPDASIGYSLGESAGLFSARAWRDRDVMFQRTLESELFRTQLGGPCTVAREVWGPDAEWTVALVMRPAAEVRSALHGNVHLLIVNAPRECVIGGDKDAVRTAVAKLGGEAVYLEGVPCVHLPLVDKVRKDYRALHELPTTPPKGVRFYSAAWGRAYEVTADSSADSVTDDAVLGFDFTKVIEQAWNDGVRVFVEAGPQGSCTRMIGKILEGRPHLAVSACQRGQDGYFTLLQALAAIVESGREVDLTPLYGTQPPARIEAVAPVSVPVAPSVPELPAMLRPEVFAATAQAHEAYLAFAEASFANQLQLLRRPRRAATVTPPKPAPRFDRDLCLEFAIGKLSKVLGPRFAEVDSYPTRVRLPDEPLMLVDRITEVEGEAGGMGSGRLVTEHDVRPGAWYLDGGRVPVCISVEAGQADLFLSSYLGIDLQTKGQRVYRLLDAKVVFHRDLPKAGEVIRYDIKIDRFIKQGDTWLFFFRFDGTIDGQPLITMYDGCAGFFSAEQLSQGKGIVLEGRPSKRTPHPKVAEFQPLLPHGTAKLNELQVAALRHGDLSQAFDVAFPVKSLSPTLRLPTGRMQLVDRILELDTQGGESKLGLVIGEHDVTPDAWYLTCHFKDDNVMPGTLMYECCLHTLRVLLLRLGWVDDAEDVDLHYAPVVGAASQLKCRGQVLASTQKVQYRVAIDEIGYDPEPFVIATASMFADGKHVVQMEGMSVRIRGLTKERLERLHSGKPTPQRKALARFSREQILEYCEGLPSRCFGPKYEVFDSTRKLARLPRPPYLFMDRVLECEPTQFSLAPGGWITCEYDVPPDAWYFRANRQAAMPFAVLLEAALQPCGFLAAYAGSALDSSEDLKFRNLDGRAHLHREVFPDVGTLTLRSRLTKVSKAGGMLLENFDFEVLARGEKIYTGTTGFGFFPQASLDQQVGLRGAARLQAPSGAKSWTLELEAPVTPEDTTDTRTSGLTLPAKSWAMIDRIEALSLSGGAKGLGFVSGSKQVDPAEWFFRAHFFQDPVMPGSLGLEALIQLLETWARERFPQLTGTHRFQALGLNEPHVWQYRGQVIPTNQRSVVEANITRVVDGPEPLIVADGQLLVDGKIIYAMKDFSLRLVREVK